MAIPSYISELIAKGYARPRTYSFKDVGAGSFKVPEQAQVLIYNIKYHHFINVENLREIDDPAKWRLTHQLRISGEKTSEQLFHTNILLNYLNTMGGNDYYLPNELLTEWDCACYFDKGFINFEIAMDNDIHLQVAGDPPRTTGIKKEPLGYGGLNTPRAVEETLSGTGFAVLPFSYEATKSNPPVTAPYSNTWQIPYNDQTQVRWINVGDGLDTFRRPLVHIQYVEIDMQADFKQKGKL